LSSSFDNTKYLDYLFSKTYIDVPIVSYGEFIIGAAISASENITVRKDLTYKYKSEQIDVLTESLVGLGYKVATEGRHRVKLRILFYKPLSLDAVLIEINVLQETVTAETYATTPGVNAFFKRILSTLDKIDYVISLDVFSKDEKESTEIAMSSDSSSTVPDFYYPFLSNRILRFIYRIYF
jgi:hypothetical protein